ncbi:uncharacterized protein MKZ38_010288 [Zalerion maritima]|uniref:Uncharacterized protein n=1 Tax=Zalerion maritima TaxID=339359 RepID=A0AAD5RSD7_9PEZI|nr:uncharacterized protein MKZ38_010288 [Zalerion maritima]
MRSSNALIAGLLAQVVTAIPSDCFKEKVLDRTDRCHSSQKEDLKVCLSSILDNIKQTNLGACFEEAGCDSLDAKFEAQWVIESCYEGAELRKRADDDEDEDADTTTTGKSSEATTSAKEEETTTEETTQEETTTAEPETTTADADTTEATAEETSSVSAAATTTADVTETATDATDSTDATADSVSTGSTSVSECYTTITYTTEGWDIINTNTAGRVSRTFNSEKVAAKTQCADGLVCIDESCMVAENSLRGSGIAVAIFFATAAAVSLFTLCFLCCRDRRNDKKLRAKMEAAKIAKEAAKPTVVAGAGRAIGAGRRSPSGNDRQPLMNKPGMYPPSPGSGRPSHDPFGDQRR